MLSDSLLRIYSQFWASSVDALNTTYLSPLPDYRVLLTVVFVRFAHGIALSWSLQLATAITCRVRLQGKSLMQEVSRIRRFIDKSTGKVNLPQKTIEGVVHLQPRLHAPIDSLPTLLVIVTFPVTYLKVVLPRLPQLQSTVIAPQTKHLEDVQRVRMASEALPFAVPLPDCPRVQAAFCAGILHPEGADRAIPCLLSSTAWR